MSVLRRIGWVLARPFVWYWRVTTWAFGQVWFIVGWCLAWAGSAWFAGPRWMVWIYLGIAVTLLGLRAATRRMNRKTKQLIAEAAEVRTMFLARVMVQGVPVEVANRAADLLIANRPDDAASLLKEYVDIIRRKPEQ